MTADESKPAAGSGARPEADFQLHRWLVYFASGSEWSSVGEFVAPDESTAVERARGLFGEASAYRAEKIPWDCAPFHRPRG